ncbi:MAG TPA: hypothetical protein PKA88_35330 [Polyangiaceae bacterium]|nr:hypothetical protein [Polyangiaceae bacterium]
MYLALVIASKPPNHPDLRGIRKTLHLIEFVAVYKLYPAVQENTRLRLCKLRMTSDVSAPDAIVIAQNKPVKMLKWNGFIVGEYALDNLLESVRIRALSPKVDHVAQLKLC